MGSSLSWGNSFGKAWGASFGQGDAITLTPARYDNINLFYSAVIGQTTQNIEPTLVVNNSVFLGAYLVGFPPANFAPPWARQPMPSPEEQPREATQVTETPRQPMPPPEEQLRVAFQVTEAPRATMVVTGGQPRVTFQITEISRAPMPPIEEQSRGVFQVTETPRGAMVVTENSRQPFDLSV